MSYRISQHAVEEMKRRRVSDVELEAAMACIPGEQSRNGLVVRQVVVGGYLIRAVVNPAAEPETVVTVYRTSKLRKYGAVP